eukprot:UN11952
MSLTQTTVLLPMIDGTKKHKANTNMTKRKKNHRKSIMI